MYTAGVGSREPRLRDGVWDVQIYLSSIVPSTVERKTPRDLEMSQAIGWWVADKGKPPVHFRQCVLRRYSHICSSFYVGPGERIVPCSDGYSFVCKCFIRKCVHPLEIDDRVFLPKSPGSGTPEVWLGTTGVTVACPWVRSRAPPETVQQTPLKDCP